MEEEVESGNSLIAPTGGFERNRDSEGNKGSIRNKYCSIGKITSTVLIIVLGSAVSVLYAREFRKNNVKPYGK